MATTTVPQKKNIRFDPASFEEEMRLMWEKDKPYATTDSSDSKQYILVMFPYPSGDGLHTGHARIYCGTDVLARYYRMNGVDVLHPMGWDAFGLPAENHAIKVKKNPKEIVPGNIENFKNQFRMLGISYDWDKEINTTDPRYYAITQELFILFYKHGLLYKKDTDVFYCPTCKTGLAQEEVEGNGTHERCGNQVERKTLSQWIFRITEYAESLIDGLNDLDWPTGIIQMQKNWIGKKNGVDIDYPLEDTNETVTCFTTRPETQYGATFVVLAPEHELSQKIVRDEIQLPQTADINEVKNYITSSLLRTERERKADDAIKTGVNTGLYALNRMTGEHMPVWISDFVLKDVGTGAVVGVPAHDERDKAFAQTFNIPIKEVIDEEKNVLHDSGEFSGMDINNGALEMTQKIEKEYWGKKSQTLHLRDWIFSRQRYWGEPIPMIHCADCEKNNISYWNADTYADDRNEVLRLDKGPRNRSFNDMIADVSDKMHGWFPLNIDQLPLELPDIEKYEPTQSGESPLSAVESWVHVKCPVCGGNARRETDTMPNWAGSCWYFLAYPGAEKIKNGQPRFNDLNTDVKKWMPVDWYVGGAEHAVLHLLYARFWMHILHDLGSITFREPFTKLRNVGMVQAEGGAKMSKSKGNVVNPNDIINEYGADALRVYEMFMAPFNQEIAWSVQTLQGSYRFVKRIWQIYTEGAKIQKSYESADKQLVAELQVVIEKITKDIPDVKYNTPVSSMMEFLNLWEASQDGLDEESAEDFLKLLAPFAPYMTDKIWHSIFDHESSIHTQSWPKVREEYKKSKNILLPVQVNGKVRETLEVAQGKSKDEIEKLALSSNKVQEWIKDSEYTLIYVQDRIVNFVLQKA